MEAVVLDHPLRGQRYPLVRPRPDELGEWFDTVLDDLDTASGQQLADRLVQIEHVVRRAEAATISVLDEADRRGAWRADGHASVRGWAAATVRWSPVQVRDRLREIRLVRDVPQVRVELAAGRLGVAQAAELARARANPRCGGQLARDAPELLRKALDEPFESFRTSVRSWENLADEDGAHKSHEAAHAGRRVHLSEVDGTFHLSGQFGAEQGSAIRECLERFAQAEFDAEWDDLRSRFGDDATPSMMERTAAQRRADAFHAIVVKAASSDGAPRAGEPLVNIVIDHDTFARAADRLFNTERSTAEPDDDVGLDLTDRRCQTHDGIALDPLSALAAGLHGRVRRVVVDSAGVVIDLGRSRRLFTGSARDAALLFGVRCTWPGCGRRTQHIDHVHEWHQHGATDQVNAGPECRHNQWKTTGYTVWRDPFGQWHTYRPDGTEITTA
jgi:hypothetical protein